MSRTRLEAKDVRAMRVVEVTPEGVQIGTHFWETSDVAALGTALNLLGTRIHTAALEWEPAPEGPGPFDDTDGPFAKLLSHPSLGRLLDPVPDVAGGDVR